MVAGLLRAAVGPDGVDVAHLPDGDRLIEACVVSRPQAVVLDVDLPGTDGLELLRELRAAPTLADLPVLLLTGHGDPRYVEAAFERGADDFVSKPFDVRDLRARILRLIGRDAR